MPREIQDPTIRIGMRLTDGTDTDTQIEKVAYGGFGVIAFGRDSRHANRMVAYKTLRRELLDDPAMRASFVRECLLWVGLWDHPNIASVLAVVGMSDTRGRRPFIALEYAERGSLRDLLRAAVRQPGGRMDLGSGLFVAQQIAAGLAYLHTPDPAYLRNEPTVHRDLKPENVLIMDDGRVVITDFGLAKIIEDASAETLATLVALLGGDARAPLPSEQATLTTGLHTAAGAALGTPAYMPSEQWQDARHAGTPADMYAFGLILSELLAGRHALLDLNQPHTADEWRAAHDRPAPRLLRSVDDQIPIEVETLYLRLLARDPAARPSADETLAALRRGARARGLDIYEPGERAEHTVHNEFAHWHGWANACDIFDRYEEALERNDRALALARQLSQEYPDALAITLNTRADILNELGLQAARDGDREAAERYDTQAEATYQEALDLRAPETTEEGRRSRAFVWHMLGIFHQERRRWTQSEAAYAKALALKPDMPDTFHARAINLLRWGEADAQAGRREDAIAHLRQARVYAVTSLGMQYPPAAHLARIIEEDLRKLGAS